MKGKMNRKSLGKRVGVAILALWASCFGIKAQKLTPTSPNVQLGSWSFNDTSWFSDLGYAPVSFTNLDNQPSFEGNALQLDTNSAAWLQYNIVEADGTTNLMLGRGTVELWFLPDWNSGAGPGDWGRLERAQEPLSHPGVLQPATNSPQPQAAQATQVAKPLSYQATKNSAPETGVSPQQSADSLVAVSNTWSNQIQHTIEFYGKVVDESNLPVAGASISFVCNQIFSEKSIGTNAISDANGLFSVSGLTGSTLSVHVEKNGYYSVASQNQDIFQYWQVLNSSPFQPDSGNPVVFHLRKKQAGAKLISAAVNVKIPLDGNPVALDFLNQRVGMSGPLQFRQKKPTYQTWKQANSWSFKMEIPSGGFIEENDEFPFEAPEFGYNSLVETNFISGKQGWKTHFSKSYYFVFGSPPCYGHMTIETDITWAGARISYAVNPAGSPNLEPAE